MNWVAGSSFMVAHIDRFKVRGFGVDLGRNRRLIVLTYLGI